MSKLSKTLAAVLMCAMLSLSMSTQVSAATYTFSHGNDTSAYKCYAKTSQDSTSSTLGAQITWQINGSNAVEYGPLATGTGATVTSPSIKLKGKSGKSYGYYYVNGALKHTSTKWMNFSF